MAAAHQAVSRPLRDRQPCKFLSRVLDPEKYIKQWTDEGHVAGAMEVGALGCGTTDLQVLLTPSIRLDVDGSLTLYAGYWGCCYLVCGKVCLADLRQQLLSESQLCSWSVTGCSELGSKHFVAA